MKEIIFLMCMAWVFPCFSQADQKPLDGKKYNVELKAGKEKDSRQQLAFSEGKMSFSDAVKYGFPSETYKCKQKNDSTWTFLMVSESKKNGTMTWEGKVINERVEGTCIWTRLLENPINYTFTGREIK